MSYLVLDRLTKTFGAAVAVDALSLSVAKGELISLLGPSGCGKTTTLQMIAGFVDPTSGRATLDGADLLAKKPNQRGLGIVFQSYALFPHMTAAENVAFGLEMRGVPRAERETRVRETLALVGLGHLGDRYPRRMSGGQQQRVALARAMVIRPSLLLLDEPLSNLDAKMREEMQIELRRIQRTVGATMILVTHDQSEAMALSDRVVVMNAGRVEQIAAPQAAYDEPASAFVANFLGRTNVLPAQVAGQSVTVAGASWAVAPGAPQGEAALTVRPEKVAFVQENGVPATVRARVFQGSQWLFEVEGPNGPLTVIRQHDGQPAPEEGAAVLLGWRPGDFRVVPATAAAPSAMAAAGAAR
jgi:putative spermidine/putrescine transport system ATP-binding protein